MDTDLKIPVHTGSFKPGHYYTLRNPSIYNAVNDTFRSTNGSEYFVGFYICQGFRVWISPSVADKDSKIHKIRLFPVHLFMDETSNDTILINDEDCGLFSYPEYDRNMHPKSPDAVAAMINHLEICHSFGTAGSIICRDSISTYPDIFKPCNDYMLISGYDEFNMLNNVHGLKGRVMAVSKDRKQIVLFRPLWQGSFQDNVAAYNIGVGEIIKPGYFMYNIGMYKTSNRMTHEFIKSIWSEDYTFYRIPLRHHEFKLHGTRITVSNNDLCFPIIIPEAN